MVFPCGLNICVMYNITKPYPFFNAKELFFFLNCKFRCKISPYF